MHQQSEEHRPSSSESSVLLDRRACSSTFLWSPVTAPQPIERSSGKALIKAARNQSLVIRQKLFFYWICLQVGGELIKSRLRSSWRSGANQAAKWTNCESQFVTSLQIWKFANRRFVRLMMRPPKQWLEVTPWIRCFWVKKFWQPDQNSNPVSYPVILHY